MYQGKPMLKKIKHINYNNPSLNSVGMQGVFFTSKSPPPMIRDELLYNSRFKDSLEQEIGEVEAMKKQEKTQRTQQTQQQIDQYMSEKARSTSNNEEFHLRYRKNEVLDKVNHIPMDGALQQQYNFQGYRSIKNKQLHGFNIISNS